MWSREGKGTVGQDFCWFSIFRALTSAPWPPGCVVSQGELVLLIQPDGPFPLADWSTPWEEMVLVRGPDVMFDVVDLDPTDDIIEVRIY